MRKRYQKGSIKKYRGAWIAQWWEDGHRRKRTLGSSSLTTALPTEGMLLRTMGMVPAGANVAKLNAGAWIFGLAANFQPNRRSMGRFGFEIVPGGNLPYWFVYPRMPSPNCRRLLMHCNLRPPR